MVSPLRRSALKVFSRLLDDRLYLSLEHFLYHASWPDLTQPRTFSEKIQHRQLTDRDPRMSVFADKLRVKAHVTRLLGEDWVAPLVWTGSDPAEIPFADLPRTFVLKANHGANMNLIVSDKAALDHDQVRAAADRWLRTDFGRLHREWAYSEIPRRLLVERFIGANGRVPVDYKFYVFGGRAVIVDVRTGRFEPDGGTSAILDMDWRRQPMNIAPLRPQPDDPPRPASFDRMREAAERIGGLFPFARIDLYDVEGRPYFGEATFYPNAGLARFTPRSADLALGALYPDTDRARADEPLARAGEGR